MGKRLRNISQRLAMAPGLFGVEAYVVRVAEHLLEDEPCIVASRRVCLTGPGECLHEPERADIERSFVSHQVIRGFVRIVAIDQPV